MDILARAVQTAVDRGRPRRRIGTVTATATPSGTVEVDFGGGLVDPVTVLHAGTRPTEGTIVEAVFGLGPVVVRPL